MPAKLDQLAQQSLQRYLGRLSGISSGHWESSCGPSAPGGPAGALAPFGDALDAAVHLGLDGLPVAALMLVETAELETITRAFTGHAFPRGAKITGADRMMLAELGNILLNALLNPMVNALKKSAMPSIPDFYEGHPSDLIGALDGRLAGSGPVRTLPCTIELECCGGRAVIRLFTFLPEAFAAEIERA